MDAEAEIELLTKLSFKSFKKKMRTSIGLTLILSSFFLTMRTPPSHASDVPGACSKNSVYRQKIISILEERLSQANKLFVQEKTKWEYRNEYRTRKNVNDKFEITKELLEKQIAIQLNWNSEIDAFLSSLIAFLNFVEENRNLATLNEGSIRLVSDQFSLLRNHVVILFPLQKDLISVPNFDCFKRTPGTYEIRPVSCCFGLEKRNERYLVSGGESVFDPLKAMSYLEGLRQSTMILVRKIYVSLEDEATKNLLSETFPDLDWKKTLRKEDAFRSTPTLSSATTSSTSQGGLPSYDKSIKEEKPNLDFSADQEPVTQDPYESQDEADDENFFGRNGSESAPLLDQ